MVCFVRNQTITADDRDSKPIMERGNVDGVNEESNVHKILHVLVSNRLQWDDTPQHMGANPGGMGGIYPPPNNSG